MAEEQEQQGFLKDLFSAPPSTATPAEEEALRQLESKEETGRQIAGSAIAGLGMAAVFGPVGLAFGLGAQYIQDRRRDDLIMFERSRVQGVYEAGDYSQGELAIARDEMNRLGYWKQGTREEQEQWANHNDMLKSAELKLEQARRDELSGEPGRVARGAKLRDQALAQIENVRNENDAFSEALGGRVFNQIESDRQLLRNHALDVQTLYDNQRQDYENAIEQATIAAQDPKNMTIAKSLLFEFIAATPQDVPSMGSALGGLGAAGFAAGPAVGTATTILGTLFAASDQLKKESNPNNYDYDTLRRMADAKMEKITEFTYGKFNPETGKNEGGRIDKILEMGQQIHGLTPDQIFYQEDLTYEDMKTKYTDKNGNTFTVETEADAQVVAEVLNDLPTARARFNELDEFVKQHGNIVFGTRGTPGPDDLQASMVVEKLGEFAQIELESSRSGNNALHTALKGLDNMIGEVDFMALPDKLREATSYAEQRGGQLVINRGSFADHGIFNDVTAKLSIVYPDGRTEDLAIGDGGFTGPELRVIYQASVSTIKDVRKEWGALRKALKNVDDKPVNPGAP